MTDTQELLDAASPMPLTLIKGDVWYTVTDANNEIVLQTDHGHDVLNLMVRAVNEHEALLKIRDAANRALWVRQGGSWCQSSTPSDWDDLALALAELERHRDA